MKEYTEQNPVFSDTIQITEITDAAHADNINAAPKQLLENTLVLKEKMEQAEQMINDKATEIAKNNDELEQRVEQTLNEKSEQIDQAIEGEAKKHFTNLYGLMDKTITISGKTITRVVGDITLTSTMSKEDNRTTIKTVIKKGKENQEGFEEYTKITTLSKEDDGSKKITVKYKKKEKGE